MQVLLILIGIVLAFTVSVMLLLDQKESLKSRAKEKYTDDVNVLFDNSIKKQED